jgi:large subunit ribosomal protein L30
MADETTAEEATGPEVPASKVPAKKAPAKKAPAAKSAAAKKTAPAKSTAAAKPAPAQKAAPAAPGTTHLVVTQTRSSIGSKPKHRGTLRALGLRGIGQSNDLPDRLEIRGMIARVPHLVRVEEVAK